MDKPYICNPNPCRGLSPRLNYSFKDKIWRQRWMTPCWVHSMLHWVICNTTCCSIWLTIAALIWIKSFRLNRIWIFSEKSFSFHGIQMFQPKSVWPICQSQRLQYSRAHQSNGISIHIFKWERVMLSINSMVSSNRSKQLALLQLFIALVASGHSWLCTQIQSIHKIPTSRVNHCSYYYHQLNLI